MNAIQETEGPLNQLEMTDALRESLAATGFWSKVVGYIGIVSATVGAVFNFINGHYMIAIFGVAAAGVINMFLLQFSSRLRDALLFDNQQQFAEGLVNLKIYFKIMGWLLIITMIAVVLFMLFGMMFIFTRLHR